MITLLQPSPDGGGKLGAGAHGCFGAIDHGNELFGIALGMGWNFLVGTGLPFTGRKRFSCMTYVKWRK